VSKQARIERSKRIKSSIELSIERNTKSNRSNCRTLSKKRLSQQKHQGEQQNGTKRNQAAQCVAHRFCLTGGGTQTGKQAMNKEQGRTKWRTLTQCLAWRRNNERTTSGAAATRLGCNHQCWPNQATVVHTTIGLAEEQRADNQRSGCNKRPGCNC
jgi:hypothetical protein